MSRTANFTVHYVSGPAAIANFDLAHASMLLGTGAPDDVRKFSMQVGESVSNNFELSGALESDAWSFRFSYSNDPDTYYVLCGDDKGMDSTSFDIDGDSPVINMFINATTAQSGIIDNYGNAYIEVNGGPKRTIFNIFSSSGSKVETLGGMVKGVGSLIGDLKNAF